MTAHLSPHQLKNRTLVSSDCEPGFIYFDTQAKMGFLFDKWEFWQKQHFLLGVKKTSRVKLIFSISDHHVEADVPRAQTITHRNY